MRHGKTEYQEEKSEKIYPQNCVHQVSLSKEGEKMVKDQARKMKDFGIDFIYSSDFLRTRQTAEIVKDVLKVKDIFFEKRLRDINLGKYHERKKDDYYSTFPPEEMFEKTPKGGEGYAKLQKRIKEVFLEIEARHKEDTILIVSHGDTLLFLEAWFQGLAKKDIIKIKKEKSGMKPAEFKKLN